MQNRSFGKQLHKRLIRLMGLVGLLLGLTLFVAACGTAPSAESGAPAVESEVAQDSSPTVTPVSQEGETPANPAQESYPPPPPPIPSPQGEYPVATEPPATATPSVYPPPATEEAFAEPRFRIDPVSAGDAVVTGQAIPGMALAVIDVSYAGSTLGTGRADNEGRFSIPVQNLVEGNRLGIAFGELENGMSVADMSIKYYPHRGEGFRNLPNVGIILDSLLIQP